MTVNDCRLALLFLDFLPGCQSDLDALFDKSLHLDVILFVHNTRWMHLDPDILHFIFRGLIMLRENRNLQEAVLDTGEDAETLKSRIEAGELILFQATSQYFIAPGAKQSLGGIGWMAQGRAQPALDAVIFDLEPGEVGGPVESTRGWHLVQVQDVSDARFASFEDEVTRRHTRRKYIHQ